VYQRDSTVKYQLKMQTSRKVFSDVQKKSGAFPFNIRALEDEKRARLGLQEAVQHSLVKQYEVMYVSVHYLVLQPQFPLHITDSWSKSDHCALSYTPSNTFVAAFHFTIALLPGGPSLLTHPPVWYKPELVKTEKELEDGEIKELLSKKLRESKKDKKKKATDGDEVKEEAK
jgi:hypothetical protein